MSHISLAHKAIAEVEAGKHEEAIPKLTKALQESQNPDWLLYRSRAFNSTSRFRESLEDAELAWHAALNRNKRAALIEAQYRRAVAHFRMGEFANADCCCLYAMRLVKGQPAVEKEDPAKQWINADGLWTPTLQDAITESTSDEINRQNSKATQLDIIAKGTPVSAKEWRKASTLRQQILRAMERLPADDAARKLTISLRPEKRDFSSAGVDVSHVKVDTTAETASTTSRKKVPAEMPLRLQDFQNNIYMSVMIMSKGTDAEKLQVDFKESAVDLNPVVYPNGDEKPFTLELWGEIVPGASKFTVTKNKIELTLKKKVPGKWSQLRKDPNAKQQENQDLPARPKEADEQPATVVPTDIKAKESKAPSYPTSSKSGPKDWDSIADDKDDKEEEGVNDFFKKLYKNASPEQQRAMAKSFTESSGTSLSTNWDDVKQRTVEVSPPDGVEPKKWTS